MVSNESKRIVKGALVLTVAGIIGKMLSAGYRIPLQNITGDIGFYIYQQVYPILGIAAVLALYGFPSAISKLTADTKASGGRLSVRNFYFPLFLILLIISSMLFLLLYLTGPAIAGLVGDSDLAAAYRLAAFVFLLIPITSLLRGVFQGTGEMGPTAYSQIGEQLLRVSIIIAAAVGIAGAGADIYMIGKAAGIASIAGGALAIVILVFLFVKGRMLEYGESAAVPWKKYMQTVFLFGLAAAFNHMILLIVQLADAFTLVPGLMENGMTSLEAMQEKGIFDRGQPLIQIGAVLGSSFALAVIPNLSTETQHHGPVQSAIAFSFYLAAGAAIGLIMIFPETNVLLYRDLGGTAALRLLSMAVFLSAIVITATSILQGIGYIKRTAVLILAAFLLKWAANMMLVPVWGIAGSAAATILSLLALASSVMIELKRKLPKLAFFGRVSWPAFLKASTVMIGYILIIGTLVPSPLTSRIGLLLYVGFVAITGAGLYVLLLLRNGAFAERELAMLPFARFFIRLNKEKKQ